MEWLSLGENEEVLWHDTPTLITEVSTFVWAGILTVTVILAPIGLLMGVSSYLAVQNREYVMTTQKFYQKSGILSTSTEESAVGNMQNMSYSQSVFGSMFDFGTIEIADASDSVTFRNVNNPETVKQELTELANAHRESPGGPQLASATEPQHVPAGDPEAIQELTETVKAVNEELERLQKHVESSGPHSQDSPPNTDKGTIDTTESRSADDSDGEWIFQDKSDTSHD